MHKLSLFIITFLFLGNTIYSQCNSSVTLNQNNVTANIPNTGGLFSNFQNDEISTMFASGLWFGGIKPSGELGIKAPYYGQASVQPNVGPLDENSGILLDPNCENYNQFWQVFADDTEQHLLDFNDNGIIDNPNQNIFGYPAHGNSFFESIHGFILPDTPQKLAPFFDKNNDGIYSPDLGEYPLPSSVSEGIIPSQIIFAIYNSASDPNFPADPFSLNFEIQYTAWTFSCSEYDLVDNTVFTNHKIINRSGEQINSMHIAYWLDMDIDCATDDLLGCSPENNAFYGYNRYGIDNNCSNTPSESSPTQSVVFLNKEMSNFIFSNNAGIGEPPNGTTDPTDPTQFHNYLTGSFRFGTPLTYGGTGHDPSGSSDPTNFAFPSNPLDSLTEWTMHDFVNDPDIATTVLDPRAFGILNHGILNHGEMIEIDMAYSIHSGDGFDNAENINLMYDNFPILQTLYNNNFENYCSPDLVLNTKSPEPIVFEFSPNPTSDVLNIKFENQAINQLSIFDTFGNVLFEKNSFIENDLSISTTNFPSGVYFIFVKKDNATKVEKFIVSH